MHLTILKRKNNPGRCSRLDHGVKYLFFLMGSPLIGGFVEGQHGKKKSGVERQNGWRPTS